MSSSMPPQRALRSARRLRGALLTLAVVLLAAAVGWLLATLLRVVGYECALVRFADKHKDFYHVICVVKTDSREARTPLFRFGRYTSEGYTWKILDPSYNHSYYQLPEWLNRYRTRDGGYTFPAGVARILKINRNEYYDLCDQADQKGRYR